MSEVVSQFDQAKADRMLAEASLWESKRTKKVDPVGEFKLVRDAMLRAFANCPDKVELPYEHTEAGEREAKFIKVCDERFLADEDLTKITNMSAYQKVAHWDGSFPGPCATGVTGKGKTYAAWRALRRLYVEKNKTFAWFPARKLVADMERYEKKDCADEFFRYYDFHDMLFVDDFDKINWDYESHPQLLFSFIDWVYRKQKPCVITTNKTRKWWTEKAGDALTRRLFVDGCVEVEFR